MDSVGVKRHYGTHRESIFENHLFDAANCKLSTRSLEPRPVRLDESDGRGMMLDNGKVFVHSNLVTCSNPSPSKSLLSLRYLLHVIFKTIVMSVSSAKHQQ